MPYNLVPPEICIRCPYNTDGCVEYLGNVSFKDRDTQYRLRQGIVASCVFDNWLPGAWNDVSHQAAADADTPWKELLDQLIVNGTSAGHVRCSSGQLTTINAGFFLSGQQGGKIRGDVFQLLVGAVLWNACIQHNAALAAAGSGGPIYAALTLGDNYDLSQLFAVEDGRKLRALQTQLAFSDTSLAYSTPDFVVVDVSGLDANIKRHFGRRLTTLSLLNQNTLTNSRQVLEGHISPVNVVAALGLKTSIRSDRMYQLLFEANAWKFIWRVAFGIEPSKYYAVYGGAYGADPEKLKSVDFSSLDAVTGLARRAINGIIATQRPSDLVRQFANVLGSGTTLPTQSSAQPTLF